MPSRRAPSADRSPWSGSGRIAGPEDIRRLLTDVNQAGLGRNATALAPQLVQPATEAELTDDLSRVLPVVPELAEGLLPWPGGIRRGATVAAVGSTSLVMTLLAGAMKHGSWGAVVGLPTFGALAAGQDFRIDLSRLALVPAPGPDWPTVVSALIDGVDIVVVATPSTVAEGTVRSLAARARQRGAVLVPTAAWPGSDLVIEVTGRSWTGLGAGHGRLRRQELSLRAAGRGRAAQPRTTTITMPPPSIVGPGPDLRIPPPPDMVDTETPVAMSAAPPPDAVPPGLRPVPRPVDPWEQLERQATPARRARAQRPTPTVALGSDALSGTPDEPDARNK